MEIKIYSTPTCPYCNMAKDFLKEKNIEFTDVNVAEDEEARNEMIEKSGQMGVPVIMVKKDDKEEFIVGFDKEKLQSLISDESEEESSTEESNDETPAEEKSE